MNPKALDALRRLAAIHSQRALGELAAARAHAQAGAQAVQDAETATAQTYEADGVAMLAQWRMRAALERRAAEARAALAARSADEAEARRHAANAVAREQGVEALADRARTIAAQADARRAERSAGVLQSLRPRMAL